MKDDEDPTFEITIKGSMYRDKDLLRDFANLSDIMAVLHEIDDMVRSRLKYSDEPASETDVRLLEDIRSRIWELRRD